MQIGWDKIKDFWNMDWNESRIHQKITLLSSLKKLHKNAKYASALFFNQRP